MTSLKQYRQSWYRQTAKDYRTSERMRINALQTACEMKDILVREFQVTQVVLFGSVLVKGRFSKDSDIDLAVKGLPRKSFIAALARLISESPYEIDLKPLEDVGELLQQRIMRGKVLYAKRPHS